MWKIETVEQIDIELTSFCNIACPGCLRQEKRKQVESILDKDMINFSDLQKWISKEKFPSLKLMNFCGSVDEPTTHPEMLKIVEYFLESYYFGLLSIFSQSSVDYT